MTFVDIKVILLGDVNVGKTSIFIRYFDSKWNNQYNKSTIGCVYKRKTLEKNGQLWTVGVWDTAGSEKYQAITTTYYRNANCAILCFDPSSLKSWDRIQYWHNELQKNVDNCKFYICATKKDLIEGNELSYVVDSDAVNAFTEENNAKYFYISSKTGEGVDDIFKTMLDDCTSDRTFLVDWELRKSEHEHTINHNILRERIIVESNSGCNC